ncbi:hypothetical protein GCM10027569_50160 [Flindersiella endophytica]
MIWAAIHKRHLGQALIAALYSLLTVVYVAWPTSPDAMVGIYVVLAWMAGTVHALIIRRWAFDLPKPATPPAIQQVTPRPMPPPRPGAWMSPLQAQQQAVLAAAMNERQARDFARNLAANDPQLAHQLRIGRVDIPHREFPDGGLIDVNNVPGEALAAATGLPSHIASQMAAAAQQADGFGSLPELCALTQLPPQTFDHLADRLYFPQRLPS